MSCGRAKEYGPRGCQVAVGNGKCGETKTLGILNEFKTLYEKRMEQLDAEMNAGGDCLQEKLNLQGQWIRDLMDQNEMMARTVEQLEIEATERVQMLEEKLQSSAKCICEVMKRYREYSSSLHLDEPFQKMFYVENDLKNLLEFIRRIREDNRWSIEGLQFYDVTYKDLFGNKGCSRNDCPTMSTNNTKQDELIEEKDRKIDTLSKDTDRISQFGDPEKLSEALKNKDTEFNNLKQSMLDMRKALTEEVASKHDVICALKRDVQQLEEQCVQADKQIAFKEDIIKELRKELKQLKQQTSHAEKTHKCYAASEKGNMALSPRIKTNEGPSSSQRKPEESAFITINHLKAEHPPNSTVIFIHKHNRSKKDKANDSREKDDHSTILCSSHEHGRRVTSDSIVLNKKYEDIIEINQSLQHNKDHKSQEEFRHNMHDNILPVKEKSKYTMNVLEKCDIFLNSMSGDASQKKIQIPNHVPVKTYIKNIEYIHGDDISSPKTLDKLELS